MLNKLSGLVIGTLLVCNLALAATWSDYSPAIGSTKMAALLSRADTHQWASEWIGLGNGGAIWRNPNDPSSQGSIENWFLDNDGWYKIRSYENPAAPIGHQVYQVTCIKADVTDLNTGKVLPLLCNRAGQPYVPFLIPNDPFRVRAWGLVDGTLQYYWEATFYPNEQATDVCWLAGPRTLQVIRQQEAWWDSGGLWMNGGNVGIRPFNANGTPVEVNVPMARETTLAKGLGVFTTVDLTGPTKGIQLCLYSIWQWGS